MMKQSNYKYLLASGHVCSDINQGVLSAILPFLIAAHHYDYATAASLVLVANIAGSVVQPILGHLADKKNIPWSMSLGLLMAGGGMAATGYISSFIGLCLAVMISGIGIAMFHPTAALLVNKSAEQGKQGASISVFALGGNLGFTLGPVITTAAIGIWGLKGTMILVIPVILESILLLSHNANLTEIGKNEKSAAKGKTGNALKEDNWNGFWKMCFVVFGRSIVFYGMNTFLALYCIQVLGQSKAEGASMLTLFYGVCALCTFLGGRIADKYGYRKLIQLSFLVIFPFILLLSRTATPLMAILCIIPAGMAIGLCYSPIVVSGQNMLPSHKGLASGVTLGLAVSIGGIFAPVLGKIANNFGLSAAIMAIAFVSLVPLLFSFWLPEDTAKS